MFSIRRAGIDDMEVVFTNSNEEEVRKVSINTEAISWEKHREWFSNIIREQSTTYYIAENSDGFAGQIRFTEQENGVYIVSISLSGAIRGKGYGSEILKSALVKFFAENKAAESVLAYILPDNTRSAKIFIKNRFNYVENKVIKGKELCKYMVNRGDFVGI